MNLAILLLAALPVINDNYAQARAGREHAVEHRGSERAVQLAPPQAALVNRR